MPGLVDESLELIPDDFKNLSAEKKEKVIARFIEKCAHQQAEIAEVSPLMLYIFFSVVTQVLTSVLTSIVSKFHLFISKKSSWNRLASR